MRNRLSARSLHGGQGHHTALGDVRYRKRDTRPFVPLADADTLDGAQRASFLLQRVTSVRSLTDRAIERVDALIAAKARASASPRLLIENHNPHETVAALRDILAQSEGLYDRGVPVRLAVDKTQGGAVAHVITPGMLVLLAHRACRPYGRKQKQDGSVTEVDVRLSTQLASMYLDWSGEWRLPVLNGIASAPLLREDGGIHSAPGYDPESGMWVESIPSIEGMIPSRPAREEAAAALHLIRKTFRTFCFANAGTVFDSTGTAVVDTAKPPKGRVGISCGAVDRRLPSEPASGSGCAAARRLHVGSRFRQGSTRALHLHHRVRSGAERHDRRCDRQRNWRSVSRRR